MIIMKSLLLLIYCVYLSSVLGLNFKEYKSFLEVQSKNNTFVKLFDQHVKRFNKKKNEHIDFPCETFSTTRAPRNVHELTPADVGIIGAIGDSITAGTGITAKTPIGLINQDRGLSWSVGGDGTVEQHVTLANILKKYNPKLVGFSVKSGDFESENAHLNVADPGNEARNMPFQAQLLIDRMKADKDIDMENSWKVITMFVGGNDLCNYCGDRAEYTVEKYIGYITKALDLFHKNLPKTFVNVVGVLDIANVPLLNENIICNTFHYFTCRCGAYPNSENDHNETRQLVVAYQEGLENLVNSGRYDTKDDFTVVNQPFLTETKIPTNPDGSTNLDYFAPDCFHFSELGQESAASGLWGNMVEPVGQKRTSWRPKEPTECPDEDQPYFYTKKNSQTPQLGLGAGLKSIPLQSEGGFQRSPGIPLQKGAGFQQPVAINKQNSQIGRNGTITGIIVGAMALIGVSIVTVYFIRHKRKRVDKSVYTAI